MHTHVIIDIEIINIEIHMSQRHSDDYTSPLNRLNYLNNIQ
jgi:hypothetical protein